MLFVSLITFLFTLFHCFLQSPVLLFAGPYIKAGALLVSSPVSTLVVTLVTVCCHLVLSGLTATREHIMSLWSGLLKNSGQQCCAK
jgi:hypothetical protein